MAERLKTLAVSVRLMLGIKMLKIAYFGFQLFEIFQWRGFAPVRSYSFFSMMRFTQLIGRLAFADHLVVDVQANQIMWLVAMS